MTLTRVILPLLFVFLYYTSALLAHFLDTDSSEELYDDVQNSYGNYDDQYLGDPVFENEHKAAMLAKQYESDYYDNNYGGDQSDVEDIEARQIRRPIKRCREVRHGPFRTLDDNSYIVRPETYYNISCRETYDEHFPLFEERKRGTLIFYCKPNQKNRCETEEREIHIFKRPKAGGPRQCWHRDIMYIKAGCKCS